MNNDQKNQQSTDETMEKTMPFEKDIHTSSEPTPVSEEKNEINRAERRKQEASQQSQKKRQQEELDLESDDKENSRQKRKSQKKELKRNLRVRLIPIWLRLLIIIVVCFLSLTAGAMIGYGVVGKGKMTDVFQKQTWQHIVDIIYKSK